MKKLLLLTLVSICLLSSCQKETESMPADTATKVFIQVDALNADGTVNSSEIAIVD